MPAIDSSPIDDKTFSNVFSLSGLAVLASMLAYLFAQFIDIKIYHFWKKLTKGKMLWLRNNFSTFSSQIIDTVTVISLLCLFEVLSWDSFLGLVVSGIVFKILIIGSWFLPSSSSLICKVKAGLNRTDFSPHARIINPLSKQL